MNDNIEWGKTERWITIPNWDRFQHYPDRDPIWIKNYRALLHDDDYRQLTGEQRAILHGLWLDYAASSCRLKLDTTSLTYRLGLRVTTKQLEALNHAGFIEFTASKPLAKRYQHASAHDARKTREDKNTKTKEQDLPLLKVQPYAVAREEPGDGGQVEQRGGASDLQRLGEVVLPEQGSY